MEKKLKNLKLHTARSNSKASDYFENAELLVREVFIRSVQEALISGGIENSVIDEIEGMTIFLREFNYLWMELSELYEDEINK